MLPLSSGKCRVRPLRLSLGVGTGRVTGLLEWEGALTESTKGGPRSRAGFWLFPLPGAVVSNHWPVKQTRIVMELRLVNRTVGTRLGPGPGDPGTPTLVTADLHLAPG